MISHLGLDSGEIIGRVIEDIVMVSTGKDYVASSEHVFDCLRALHDFSKKRIYESEDIKRQRPEVEHRLKVLFNELLEICKSSSRGRQKRLKALYTRYEAFHLKVFLDFLSKMKYGEDEPDERIVLDFVAGMTDNFALECYNSLFPIRTR